MSGVIRKHHLKGTLLSTCCTINDYWIKSISNKGINITNQNQSRLMNGFEDEFLGSLPHSKIIFLIFYCHVKGNVKW